MVYKIVMVYTVDMVYSVDTGDEGDHSGKDWTEVLTSIWKVTVACRCTGVF